MPHIQPALQLIGVADLAARAARILPLRPGAIPEAHRAAAEAAGFTAAAEETLLRLDDPEGVLLLLGIGDGEEDDEESLEGAGAEAAAALWDRPHIVVDGRGLPRSLSVPIARGAALRAWAPPQFRQGRRPPEAGVSDTLRLDLLVGEPERIGRRWREALATVEAVCLARHFVAEPSNFLTPKVFATRLRDLEEAGIAVEILSGRALATKGLGLLQAVGRGSAHPPQLVILRWPGTLDQPPIAFVGKGVTFDTGGISIKPADGMWEMRGDMAGAAACAGAMLALARRGSPTPAVAVLALAENMTGAESYRPGDVIRGHAGLTVEIVDTDAEGRLVLADALSYVIARFRPRAVIDVATLTYAVGVALGQEMAGVYANDTLLAAHLAAAGAESGDAVWRLPVTEAQREELASEIADIKQCLAGDLVPDAALAAAFLGRFVGDTPWAHIDIGAMDMVEEAEGRYPAGPTGFGVRLLDRLVATRYEDPTILEAGMMAEIGFYHLMRTTTDAALPPLLGRTLAAGKRAVIRCGSAERLAALDTALWQCQNPDWLPHGHAAMGHAEWQPIWLTEADEAPNGATFLFLIDGQESATLDAYERVFDLFDGNDGEAVAAARKRWVAAKAAGHQLSYWQQGPQGWERKQ